MISMKSTLISLIFTGRIQNLLTPWEIIIDFDSLVLTFRKRNWHLISSDENVVPFRYIRRIDIDRHLFGAEVNIKVYGSGTLSVNSIIKKGLKKLNNN